MDKSKNLYQSEWGVCMKPYPYQWRALFLMVLAWGFAGLAHNCVSFLFPYFSVDFQLGTQHNGYLTATLAFFWTLSILYCGPKANRIGQVKVMVPGLLLGAAALAVLAFSGHVLMLYVVTAIAGFGCGSIVSASLSFLAEQSDPNNRGLFYGVAMSSFTLIGSAMGSVVFTRLGATAAGWRGCYVVMAALVLLAAVLIFLLGRKIPRHVQISAEQEEPQSFWALFAYRNVILSTVLACLTMMWYFTVAAYTILYLMEAKELSAVAAGAIFAGFGSGGFIGEFGAPIVSDYLGRKKTAMFASLAGSLCFALFMLCDLPATLMTLAIAGASFFLSGAMAILNSVVPSESVPAELVATATSFTPAAGELMGGVAAPVIAGALSGLLGMTQVMNLLMVLPVLVCVGSLFLKETAPAVLARKGKAL